MYLVCMIRIEYEVHSPGEYNVGITIPPKVKGYLPYDDDYYYMKRLMF